MRNLNLLNVGLSLSLVVLASCGTQNRDRQGPPEQRQYLTVSAAQTKMAGDPKVNILFVVDNSGSMKPYQEKMAANISQFAKEFFSNNRIDYRIGVVPVYDSKYLNDTTVYTPSGRRKMNPLGELVPLKGVANGNGEKPQLFITRDTPHAGQVLEQTVVIGTQWGPEAEESFSPVLAVADSKINTEKNQGFYQQDAYLAVIFLTDADDVTPGLSADMFYEKLVQMKGGDASKVLIAAAIRKPGKSASGCPANKENGAVRAFPTLMEISGGITADLCSDDFGARLAQFGKTLARQVSSQRIELGFTPDIDTLEVTYGPIGSKEEDRVKIPRGVNGYKYDSGKPAVLIDETLRLPRKENAAIFVKAMPVNLSNYKNGRLKPY